jgi:hypothetical protein
MKRIFVLGLAILVLTLLSVSCAPKTVYVDTSGQQQYDDQYYAQQAYTQWQMQNPNRDFDYFLAMIWADQWMRSNYYTSFHVYNYSAPRTTYSYRYQPNYTGRSSFGSSGSIQSSRSSGSFSSSSSPSYSAPRSSSFGSSGTSKTLGSSFSSSSSSSSFTPKASFGSGSSSFGSSRSSGSFGSSRSSGFSSSSSIRRR